MILLFSSDLMMAATARSFAQQNSVPLQQTNSLEQALEIISEHRPQLLMVDLQTPGLDIAELGRRVGELSDSVAPLTLAYAQHVNVDKLEAGKQAGFDQVLTRGQINSQMGKIIAGIR